MTERVFFVVDRTKLKEETDELRNAIVVYMPKSDLKRTSLEQRCSQLVGISILVTNLTGTLPRFVRLKSLGFAIRPLGQNYIMGLSSRLDEPHSCVIQYINHIHSFFKFYYDSPAKVMESSLEDWEIFTRQMETIFQSVLDFTFRDTHSLPAMFSPLPYVPLDTEKGAAKLFLKSQRLLRHFQLQSSIIGGCIFYKGEVLSSQLPPLLVEKMLLVANDGVQLNNKSVLEDKIAPESVWLINVFLTGDEMQLVPHLCPDHQTMRDMFSSLHPNPNLTSGILLQQKAARSQWDRSSKHQKKLPKPSQYDHAVFKNFVLTETAESKDGDLSSSLTASNEVSPIKKVWSLGRTRALGRIRADSLQVAQPYSQPHPMANRPLPTVPGDLPDQARYHIPWPGFSAPPPLPPRKNSARAPPPVPSHKGPEAPPVGLHNGRTASAAADQRRESVSPPPIPSRGSSTAQPPPVPLRGISSGPPPVPERENPVAPPPIPARGNLHDAPAAGDRGGNKTAMPPDSTSQLPWIYSDNIEREEESIPPLEFQTPSSSIVTTDTSLLSTPLWKEGAALLPPDIPPRIALDDSDSSDGYATPSPTFPTESSSHTKAMAASCDSPQPGDSQSSRMSQESPPIQKDGSEETVERGRTVDEVDMDKLKLSCLRRGVSLEKKSGVESSGELVDSLEPSQGDSVTEQPSAAASLQEQGDEALPSPPESHGGNEAAIRPSNEEEVHQGSHGDDDTQRGREEGNLRTKKISQCSVHSFGSDASSLVITKAVSEYGSVGSLSASHTEDEGRKWVGSVEVLSGDNTSLGGEGEEVEGVGSSQPKADEGSLEEKDGTCADEAGRIVESVTPTMLDDDAKMVEREESEDEEANDDHEVEFLKEDSSHSPTFHDLSISTSDSEDHLSKLPERRMSGIQPSFPYTLPGHSRAKADTWLGRKISLTGPEERPLVSESHDPPLVQKCLYVQKCVNTVVAILADCSLPHNHQLIKDLWTQLITHLVQINNSLESCVMDREPVNTDYGRLDGGSLARNQQTYFHAAYSTTTGMCAVSSPSAPYQFRHAVRRAHQEYSQQPNLRQISLCKEHCKMICQNVLGKEQYFQPLKTGPVDSLGVHAALERGMRLVNESSRGTLF